MVLLNLPKEVAESDVPGTDPANFGGERGTRTLDLGIMRKSLLTQSLSDVVSGSVPVFVRIFPGSFSHVRTKSDTVMRFTAEALQSAKITRAGRSGSFRYSR